MAVIYTNVSGNKIWIDAYEKEIEHEFDDMEKLGFKEKFSRKYDDIPEVYDGQRYSILRRCTEKECLIEDLPMWHICFADGYETDVYPEEIINIKEK